MSLTAFAWLNPVQLSLVLLGLVLIPGLLLSKFSLLPNQKQVQVGYSSTSPGTAVDEYVPMETLRWVLCCSGADHLADQVFRHV